MRINNPKFIIEIQKALIGWIPRNKKSFIGRTHRNPRIHPSYNFCDSPSKVIIQSSKWKFWNFSELSLSMNLEIYLFFGHETGIVHRHSSHSFLFLGFFFGLSLDGFFFFPDFLFLESIVNFKGILQNWNVHQGQKRSNMVIGQNKGHQSPRKIQSGIQGPKPVGPIPSSSVLVWGPNWTRISKI